MADDWVNEHFKPDDINDIRSISERIVRDDGTWIEISMIAPIEGARDFLDRYEQAVEGNIMSMFEMMTFLGAIADSLAEGVNMDAQD